MDSQHLIDRSKQLALECWKLADSLPRTPSGQNAANQISRSATAIAANYRAALRSRSYKEWIARLSVVVEEADETLFWLEMIQSAKLAPSQKLQNLLIEAEELVKIFNSSLQTSLSSRNKS